MGAVILNLPELSVDFLKTLRKIRCVFFPTFYIETFTRFKTGFDLDLIMRLIAAKIGWPFVFSFIGMEMLDTLQDSCGCDVLKDADLEQHRLKIAELKIAHFKEFECRLVRDVGPSKWMVCCEVIFNKDTTKRDKM